MLLICKLLITAPLTAAMLGVVYFYPTVINPENPLFIDRYFISVEFCLLYITAVLCNKYIDNMNVL